MAAAATEARMTDGTLVVSVGGDAPRLWRANMAGMTSASFELQDAAGQTAVVLKNAAGTETVHAFASRAEAAAALKAISDALFSGARAAPSAAIAAAPATRGSFWGKFFRTIIYLVIAIVCVVALWVAAQIRHVDRGEMTQSGTGVPMPADQMFGK